MREAVRALLAGALAASTIPLLVGTTLPDLAILILPIVAITALVAWQLDACPRLGPRVILGLAVLSLGIAVVSVLTGALNGLSDEPYSTPAYATLGWHLYSQPVSFTYTEYGRTLSEQSYDVYLPLLSFVQIPGLDYRWVALGAWGATAYRLRGSRFASSGWSTPWIALLAANGQNDFVPLLALTFALGVPLARGSWAAELVTLCLKQFANVIVAGYHLLRREYGRAALAALVTVAILAPFLYLDPGGVYCHVVLGDPTSGCAPHSAGFVLFKRNYWLYPTWVGLVFRSQIVAAAGRLLRRVRPGFPEPSPS